MCSVHSFVYSTSLVFSLDPRLPRVCSSAFLSSNSYPAVGNGGIGRIRLVIPCTHSQYHTINLVVMKYCHFHE